MEGEVVAPMFLRQSMPAGFVEPQAMGKKRNSPWANTASAFQHAHPLEDQHRPAGWDPRMWKWDSMHFAARPSAGQSSDERSERGVVSTTDASMEGGGDTAGDLSLKLGGGLHAVAADGSIMKPNKRVKSGSPGGGGNYPMCQVDDCRRDLSNAKDYHRRHKVCELHSKTTRALVSNQMQRFCQQCSRFHLLSEFDEGKRSCRRRLAGHNRRRRKTHPDDNSSQSLPVNQENNDSGSLDIVNLLSVLVRLQGNSAEKLSNLPPLPDKERLMQILCKINSLPPANPVSSVPIKGDFDLNVSQAPQQYFIEQVSKDNGTASDTSTMDLLGVLSGELAAAPVDPQASLSQGSCHTSGKEEKGSLTREAPTAEVISQRQPQALDFVGGARGSCHVVSPREVCQPPIQEAQPSLLQLFTSPENRSPEKWGSSRNYFSYETNNQMEVVPPSPSSAFVQNLFPLHSTTEDINHKRMSIYREDKSAFEISISCGCDEPLELSKNSERCADVVYAHNRQCQGGYASSSGSDHSPSISNFDQDRTGRIIFKLFDKDPSDMPRTLRTQIFNWLLHSPTDMESHIRPGCVVLSIYLCMASTAWDELEDKLIERVNSLVEPSESDFWRKGRFLVCTNKHLASYNDGKIRICKPWRTHISPELVFVSPVAVVGGKETSLVLRGRNLTAPGTKIHCTSVGGYTSKEVVVSAYSGTKCDASSLESAVHPGGTPTTFGRCFIEVENGFKGNSFPVIIANADICQELHDLEAEFKETIASAETIQKDQCLNHGRLRSCEDILHFLNELGWLFQRKSQGFTSSFSTDFSIARFKFLFLVSAERDWPVLIKTLLDILVESVSFRQDKYQESIEMLHEIQLLSRAVKRKSRKMVDLLVNYNVKLGVEASKFYLFPPNMVGPSGLTPLHLAACTQGSEEMVDALTNDPQEIGLACWNSLQDSNGHSPYMYALMENNYSYNTLVVRKLVDRKRGQISVTVENTQEDVDKSSSFPVQVGSCLECANEEMRRSRPSRRRGFLPLPYSSSLLAIAAVCVCVCLFCRGSPDLGSIAPFNWMDLQFGSI